MSQHAQIILSVGSIGGLCLRIGFQMALTVLAQQFMDGVAPAVPQCDQGLVYQPGQVWQAGPGHMARRFAVKAASEHTQALEHGLFRRGEHPPGVVKNDRVEVYVDGKLAGTTKTPGYIPGNCGQGMEIGFDVANSPAEITDNFEGILDEVKVYHAALTEKEIAEEGMQAP